MKYAFRPTLLTTLIVLVIFSGLLNLGFWQLNRAEFKKLLKMQYFERSQTVITSDILNNKQENLRFFKIKLTGRFDNTHVILIPNKTNPDKTNYEVYTPFDIFGDTKTILIDRGVVQPQDMKKITPIFGEQEIKGILDNLSGPLNTQLKKINRKLKREFYPYIIISHTPKTLPIDLTSDKNVIYAFQWFGLAGILLFAFIAFNIRKNKSVFGNENK